MGCWDKTYGNRNSHTELFLKEINMVESDNQLKYVQGQHISQECNACINVVMLVVFILAQLSDFCEKYKFQEKADGSFTR